MKKINLFVIGAAKSGTTSLYNYLSLHREILVCPVKEPHFFTRNILNNNEKVVDKDKLLTSKANHTRHTYVVHDENLYHKLFDHSQNEKYWGDFSPSYLWDEDAARRIYDYNPEAKIIIMLRQPIKRILSHYQMDISTGAIAFNETLEKTIARDSKKEKKGWGYSGLYIELSQYERQVKRYHELFDEKNILIMPFELFIKYTDFYIQKICDFLDISYGDFTAYDFGKIHNETFIHKHRLFQRLHSTFRNNKILKYIPICINRVLPGLRTVLREKPSIWSSIELPQNREIIKQLNIQLEEDIEFYEKIYQNDLKLFS